MANIFLDANILIDIFGIQKYDFGSILDGNNVVISALSIHILSYISKIKIPNKELNELVLNIKIIGLNEVVERLSLIGPTNDFEDNVQLHSAVVGDCDYFLTLDKKLLKMKFFGKIKICDRI